MTPSQIGRFILGLLLMVAALGLIWSMQAKSYHQVTNRAEQVVETQAQRQR